MLQLVTDTEANAAAIADRLTEQSSREVHGLEIRHGRLAGVEVGVAPLGVGRSAAAFALSRLLLRPPAAVVLVGAARAYPDTSLARGDVVVATSDTYADLGEETPDGLADLASIGIRLAPGAPGQTFLHDPRLVQAMSPEPAVNAACLTAETATTSAATAARLAARWGPAWCESREGATTAHLCLLESVPCAQLREVTMRVGAEPPPRQPTGVSPAVLEILAEGVPRAVEALAHPFS